MKQHQLNIKTIKEKPHKVVSVKIEYDYQIKSLCRFLRKQKERKLEIIINGRRVKFDSLAGMKRFASGFESSFKIIEQQAKAFHKDFIDQISKLKNELAITKRKANEQANIYAVKSTTMDIRQAAWQDHISELEGDRAILKAELDALKKPKTTRRRKTKKKTVKKGKKR